MRILLPSNNANLISLIQARDKEAFGLLYDTYSPYLYGYIIKSIDNNELAASVLEKLFIKIWSESKALDYSQQKIMLWMFGICKQMVDEELKKMPIKKQHSPTNISPFSALLTT